jgi:hypothetical protein
VNLTTRPTGERLANLHQGVTTLKEKHQGDQDAYKALDIWRDFKWKVQTTGTSMADVATLLDEAIEKCAGLKTKVVRDMAIKRLREMAALVKTAALNDAEPAA